MEDAIFEEVTGTFVGIDLGTSNSVVSYFKDGEFAQVNFKGKTIIPSVLYIEDDGKILFGDRANKKGAVTPERLLKEFKRDIGSNVKYKFEVQKQDFEQQQSESRLYVIDTNIFIENFEIIKQLISVFGDSLAIRIPVKVIDELKYRQSQEDTEASATYALEEIDRSLTQYSNVQTAESHEDLISQDLDMDKNSNGDNKILSVAKYFTINHPEYCTYLLTNDKALSIKADTESVKTQKLAEFKLELGHHEQQYDENNQQLILTPKEASRLLLSHIRDESEKYLNEIIDKAVITVPANFSPSQIDIVKDAAEMAGFSEVRIQKEPVAVGFAYSLEEQVDKTILVYDFGGGTFDASILRVDQGLIEVVAVDGNTKLGGVDITDALMNELYEKLIDAHDLDMFSIEDSGLDQISFDKNKAAIWRKAEEAKIELTSYESVSIAIPNLSSAEGLVNFETTITRNEFDSVISDFRKKSIDVVKELLQNANIKRTQIDEIVMAGGTSSIPSIRNSLNETLGIEPKQSIDTSVVISQGAVLEAMRQWSESDSLQEKLIFNDNALQDFGIGVKDHKFDLLIAAGTELPVRSSRIYTTETDNQETLSIRVFQRKAGNTSAIKTYDKGIVFVDDIKISGLPPSKVGELSVEVSFELTKDDSLQVKVNVTSQNSDYSFSDSLTVSRASNE